MDLVSLVKEIGMGAISGYLTNDYAVKMLFRQYGPFGGVIIKTREEFIEKISQLIEQQLINDQTLQTELGKDSFQAVITEMITEILAETLAANTPDLRVGQLPGIEPLFAGLRQFCDTHQTETINETWQAVFAATQLETLVTPAQSEQLSANILKLAIRTLKEQEAIVTAIREFYREHGEVPLAEFISGRLLTQVVENFKAGTGDLHRRMQDECHDVISRRLDSFYTICDFDRIFAQVEAHLKQRRLIDIFGVDRVETVAAELIKNIAKIVKSAEGRALIERLVGSVLETLENDHSSLVNLLHPQLQERFRNFMLEEFPYLIGQFQAWIRAGRTEIEQLIDAAIDESLLNDTYSIRGLIKKALKDYLIGYNVAQRFSLVEKIAAYLEDDRNLSLNASREVAKRIYEYLESTSIGTIIKTLKDRNILQTGELVGILTRNIDHYLSRIEPKTLNRWFEIKVGDLVKVDLHKYLAEYTKNVLSQWLQKDFLYSPGFTRLFHNEVNKIIEATSAKGLARLIGEESLAQCATELQQTIVTKLEGDSERWRSTLSTLLLQYSHNKNFLDVIGVDGCALLSGSVSRLLTQNIEDGLSGLKYTKVKSWYERLNAIPGIAPNLSQVVTRLIAENLDLMVKGNIQEAVKRNLTDLSDREVQTTVEEFMGTELKPISVLGAFFGAVFGAGTFAAESTLLPDVGKLTTALTSTAVCAFVGWLTNVVAIRMIFRPYRHWKVAGGKLPFTPGVIPKQKARFAKSMARFVDQRLLNPETVSRLFNERSEVMKQSILATLAKDNYQMLEELVERNRERIVDGALRQAAQFVAAQQGEIVELLTDYLKTVDLTDWDVSAILDRGRREIVQKAQQSREFLAERLLNLLNRDQTLGQVLPSFVMPMLQEFIAVKTEASFETALRMLGDGKKIDAIIQRFSVSFNEIIEKRLSELIPMDERRRINRLIWEQITEQVASPSSRRQFYQYFNEKFLGEVNEDEPIGELFGGKLLRSFQNSAAHIVANFERFVEGKMMESEAEISAAIIANIHANMSAGGLKSMFFPIANWALKIDGSVRDSIHCLFQTKIPGFLNAKTSDIEQIVRKVMNDKIAPCKLKDLGLTLESAGVESMVNSVSSVGAVRDSMKRLIDQVMNSLYEIKINKFLALIAVKDLRDLQRIFSEEVALLTYELGGVLVDPERRDRLKTEFVTAFMQVWDRLIAPLKVRTLTAGMDRDTIAPTLERILTRICASDSWDRTLGEFLTHLVAQIQSMEPETLINFAELNNSLTALLQQLAPEDGFASPLKEVLAGKLRIAVGEANRIFPPELKDFCAKIILESFLLSLRAHFLKLFNTIDIKQVTEDEVNQMTPEVLETMFYSFAGRYFKQLELYGVWGGVFGLLSLIG